MAGGEVGFKVIKKDSTELSYPYVLASGDTISTALTYIPSSEGITALAVSSGGTALSGDAIVGDNGETLSGGLYVYYDVTPEPVTPKIVKAIYNGVEYEINAGGGTTVEPNVEILLVGGGGGGGGGGSVGGGGGGGGGVLFCPDYALEIGQAYNISIGCGGPGGPGSACCGSRGGATDFCDTSGIKARVTGGWGGGYGNATYNCGGVGGGAYSNPSTMDYGCCAGGTNACRAGGGGGSSFSAGVTAKNYQYTYTGGNGGDGYISNISGTMSGYGGGGGGGGYNNVNGCGGTGGAGGGHGGERTADFSVDCIHAVGCGGGGGGGLTQTSCCGGNGACGVVIIRYHCDGRDGITCATGGCVYECNDYIIHCFTCDGTFCIVC